MRGVKLFIILASSYFSAGPPLQYRHRSRVSPPSGWIGVLPLRLGHQNIEPCILASDCEAPILDWKGHQRPLPFHPIERGGRAFGFFMLSKS